MNRKEVWYAIQQWRKERIAAHEQGHQTPATPELCYPDEKDGHFQQVMFPDILTGEYYPDEPLVGGFYPEGKGQEIELFNPEREKAMQEKAYPKSILTIWDEREAELEE